MSEKLPRRRGEMQNRRKAISFAKFALFKKIKQIEMKACLTDIYCNSVTIKGTEEGGGDRNEKRGEYR